VTTLSSVSGLIALSVLISLLVTILTTENPAHIPFRLVAVRALPGMLLFVFLWWVICLALAEGILSLFPALAHLTSLSFCLVLLIGVGAPQAIKLKNLVRTPQITTYLAFLQRIDEQTGLYLAKIIDREERKANITCFEDDEGERRRALDRLFEHYNVEITREEVKRLGKAATAMGIFRIRQHAMKFKLLIRFLGYSELMKQLAIVSERPETLFPTWPIHEGDRRKGISPNDTTAGMQVGRRKYEDPSFQSLILGFPEASIKRKYQVFVSSTFLDLREERQQALRSLLSCGCIPAGMEFFPSSDDELWTLIREIVDDCDYYILLVGNRYGSLTTTGISYTEAEYDYAEARGMPVLAFFHANPAALPGAEEDSERAARLQAFKEKVGRAHTPGYWNSAEELPALIHQAIENVKLKQPGRGWIRNETPRA